MDSTWIPHGMWGHSKDLLPNNGSTARWSIAGAMPPEALQRTAIDFVCLGIPIAFFCERLKDRAMAIDGKQCTLLREKLVDKSVRGDDGIVLQFCCKDGGKHGGTDTLSRELACLQM